MALSTSLKNMGAFLARERQKPGFPLQSFCRRRQKGFPLQSLAPHGLSMGLNPLTAG
jgi:hypothetical protein